MIVSTAIQKMIEFYKGNRHDVNHFLKVWAMAKTIGELEGLDRHTQEVLELAAVIHDIACPLCREKYGDTDGKHQELESPALVEAFFTELPAARPDVGRISWLAAHHHTYTDIRWIQNDPDTIDIPGLSLTRDTLRVEDMRGGKLLLFTSPWNVDWATDHNPDLILSEFGNVTF